MGVGNGAPGECDDVSSFFKSLGGRYKRIRRRCKGQPHPELYKHKIECLEQLEQLSEEKLIDLFYADESSVSTQGYVPYGWQFPNEKVAILADKGKKINCFALISRSNQCHWATTNATIDAQFILEQLEQFSWNITKNTVVVLDCASTHTAKIIRQRIKYWQQRGLFLFFLPPYSPNRNCAETLWHMLKGYWIEPEDYVDDQQLFYATNRCLANVGSELIIKFSPFGSQTKHNQK
jgi:transposase